VQGIDENEDKTQRSIYILPCTLAKENRYMLSKIKV